MLQNALFYSPRYLQERILEIFDSEQCRICANRKNGLQDYLYYQLIHEAVLTESVTF